MAHLLNNDPLLNTPTRKSFLLTGIAGTILTVGLLFLLYLLAPMLQSFAILHPAQLGTNWGSILFLLLVGLLVVSEWPLMLFLMVRMARNRASAWVLNTVHLTYTFLPALYGILGVVLTGQQWWGGVMAFLSLMRFSSSAFIHPRQLAEYEISKDKALKEDNLISTSDLPNQPAQPIVPVLPQRPSNRALHQIKAFVLDMDGVLYRGNQVRYGAIDFVNFLNKENIPYVCLTNNASRTSEMYQEKLDKLGIPIDASRVIGSAFATGEWLTNNAAPGARVLMVGEEGLEQEIRKRGFHLVEEGPADYVIVGIDFSLTYQRLKYAALAIRQNATFIGTNADRTYPSEEGIVPGNGSTLAFLEAATGIEPFIIGKPQPAIMNIALSRFDVLPQHVAMVGDRLNTDALGAHRAGMISIFLRGGVTSDAERLASSVKPDHVFHDLDDLLSAYESER